eukprot:12070562-Prorocentrum_lima.AAC.1
MSLYGAWPGPDLSAVAAGLESFRDGVKAKTASVAEFSKLLQGVPEEIRHGKGLKVKIENRQRLPSNVEKIVERLE